MDLKALRHVVTLAGTLNYTRAAEALNLSQSALTRSIQNTEQRCQLRLFDRDRGGVHLTPAGRIFVERARGLLQEADDFNRQVQRMASGEDYQIAFGMAPLPAKTLLPELATRALREYTELRWDVQIGTAPELLRMLLEEKIEFFVSAQEQFPDNAPVKQLALGDFPLSFIVRREHPLLLGGADGQRFPVVSVAPIADYSRFPPSLAAVLEHPPRLVLNDYGVLANIIRDTDAVWPMSSFAAIDGITCGELATLPSAPDSPPTHFALVMYSLRKRTLSPTAQQLQHQFQQRIQQLKYDMEQG